MQDNEREYRFLKPGELKSLEARPIKGTVKDCLKDALLDIIQLSESEGMTEEVDSVLREIIDARAARVRSKFILHTDREAPPER
jgi:hypothetical protein